MWSCGEGCPFILLDRDAELHGEAIKASAQDLRIEVCRPLLLDHSSSTIERHNEILSRRRNTVLIGPPAEKGNDGRLPIDEGSVHIKGYGIEIGKFQHHGLLLAHPRSFGATIQPLWKVDPRYFFTRRNFLGQHQPVHSFGQSCRISGQSSHQFWRGISSGSETCSPYDTR